jgi:retron-type reverse transcriptase
MADTPIDGKVQRTQTMLYAKASNEPEVRFKRLYKYMTRLEWIEVAIGFKRLYKYMTRLEWIEVAIDKILRNRGSRTAGIDGKTRSDYLEEKERAELAQAILAELCNQTYHPDPVRQTYIPKANGKKRPLGIATIKDRVVQQMVKMLIEPIFEATFLPCSYGFRPNRCTWDALAEAYYFLSPRCQYYTIIEGDIENCFGSIVVSWTNGS